MFRKTKKNDDSTYSSNSSANEIKKEKPKGAYSIIHKKTVDKIMTVQYT